MEHSPSAPHFGNGIDRALGPAASFQPPPTPERTTASGIREYWRSFLAFLVGLPEWMKLEQIAALQLPAEFQAGTWYVGWARKVGTTDNPLNRLSRELPTTFPFALSAEEIYEILEAIPGHRSNLQYKLVVIPRVDGWIPEGPKEKLELTFTVPMSGRSPQSWYDEEPEPPPAQTRGGRMERGGAQQALRVLPALPTPPPVDPEKEEMKATIALLVAEKEARAIAEREAAAKAEREREKAADREALVEAMKAAVLLPVLGRMEAMEAEIAELRGRVDEALANSGGSENDTAEEDSAPSVSAQVPAGMENALGLATVLNQLLPMLLTIMAGSASLKWLAPVFKEAITGIIASLSQSGNSAQAQSENAPALTQAAGSASPNPASPAKQAASAEAAKTGANATSESAAESSAEPDPLALAGALTPEVLAALPQALADLNAEGVDLAEFLRSARGHARAQGILQRHPDRIPALNAALEGRVTMTAPPSPAEEEA